MIVLRFRHDSTTSEWRFEGIDEPALRRMLQELNVYAAEPGSADAVLEAQGADGQVIGAWSRGGAAHLASLAFRERTTPPWSEMEAAIQGAVMDPHPDEATPA
jgi:hypothetical protein